MTATESITYRELVRELKNMVERDNLEGLVDYLEVYQDSEIPWDTLFKDVYLHACLKKQKRIVDWLLALYEEMPIVLITGASQNHFKSLLQLLRSVPAGTECYVYDLGLDAESIAHLETHPIRLRHFDYSKYPPYYNIHVNAGEYAWKPAIILEVFKELSASYTAATLADTVLLWCDAGDCLPADIQHIEAHTQEHKLYSPLSSGNVQRWTHPLTLEWFSIPPSSPVLQWPNRNGAILAFAIGDPRVQAFLQKYAECASIKDCIAPTGSSRENHRQDQSVFTLLFYKFILEHKLRPCVPHYMGIRIHCDID